MQLIFLKLHRPGQAKIFSKIFKRVDITERKNAWKNERRTRSEGNKIIRGSQEFHIGRRMKFYLVVEVGKKAQHVLFHGLVEIEDIFEAEMAHIVG